jgi:hypothetical protein
MPKKSTLRFRYSPNVPIVTLPRRMASITSKPGTAIVKLASLVGRCQEQQIGAGEAPSL